MRAKFPEQQVRVALQSEHNSEISYSTEFSCIFNFANVANFQLFAKLCQQKFSSFQTLTARASMENILGLSYRIHKQHSAKKYLTSSMV